MIKKIGILLVCIMLVTSFLVVFPIITVKASGNTFYVGGSGPGNYTTIQSAIDAASSGDTVFVYSGTYYENVNVNKANINLLGESEYNTIINGGAGSTISINNQYVQVEGFTITGIYTGYPGNHPVYINYDYFTISNCIVTNGFRGISSLSGGGDYFTVEDCDIHNNNLGVYSDGAIGNKVINCNIHDNSGPAGYGVCWDFSSNCYVYHNNFYNNQNNARDHWGGVNYWNNGYPSGGNYWDDYTGTDIYHGPNQDIPGSDGIGDTPYNIPDESKQDLYPYMEQNGWLNQPPVADANGPYTGNIGETITLDGSGSYDSDGSIVSYEWDLDNDGQYDDASGVTPTYSWSTPGTHPISLKVTDDDGLTDTDDTTVYINYPPVADANGPYTSLEGVAIHFLGSVTGGCPSYTWYWDFGDGNTSIQQNPSHIYKYDGNYIATLTVNDSCSQTDIDTATVEILPALQANANGPYSGNRCNTVEFTGTATGGYTPYIWDWNFGDGTTHSNQQNPTHQYANDGSYTATLTVTDNQLNFAVDTAPVIITTTVLVAEAGGRYSGTICNSVTFLGSASGGCTPYNFSWDFGDGNTSSLQNPTHQYSTIGNYTVELTVTDSQEYQDSDTVYAVIIHPDLIVNTNDYYSGMPGYPISFTCVANGGCQPYSWHWDFGDGTISTEQYPIHTYINAGNYTAIVTVTDDAGYTDSQETNVEVTFDLRANAHGPYNGYMNIPLQFNGNASGGSPPYTWYWDFGDGHTSNQQNPQHTYINQGNYTIILTVYDSVNNFNNVSTFAEILVEDIKNPLDIFGYCPIDLIIYDPNGFSITKTSSSIMDANYTESDIDGDGDIDDHVHITYALNGEYKIYVIPESDAEPNDIFSLDISYLGNDYNITQNTRIADIPDEGYIFNTANIGVLSIENITKGFGVKFTIRNTGPNQVTNVQYSIDVTGGFFVKGRYYSDVISSIAPDGSQTIVYTGLRGIGLIIITVQAVDADKKATAFLLGPLVLRVAEV